MAKISSDDLLEAFKEMTLIELSEFVKQFEDTFGVTAAAPVAAAAPAAAGGAGAASSRGTNGTGGLLRHQSGLRQASFGSSMRITRAPPPRPQRCGPRPA